MSFKKVTNFSNFDVFAIAKELDSAISPYGIISNIYEVEDLLIIKINTDDGNKNLIIKKDSRINFTRYDYPIPQYPSQYIMSLRKFMRNRRILSIKQYNFDRIIVFELSDLEDKSWKFVIELFNRGNYLLLDGDNILKVAKKYKKFRNRDVLANREYEFPQARGKDFLTIGKEEFEDLIIGSDAEVVRILARNINIAGLYSEEIIYRAGIDKTKIAKNLNKDEISSLYKHLKDLRNELMFGDFKANIVYDKSGSEICVLPFDLALFEEYEKKYYDSFNNAVDDYYSKLDTEEIKKPDDSAIKQKIKAQKKILNNQFEYLEELKQQKDQYYEQGDFIYANFNTLQKLRNVILDARKKDYSWEQINEKLLGAKQEGIDEAAILFEKLIAPKKQLVININGNEVYLDLRESIGENANIIYSKGKKAEKKIKGTIPAIKKTEKKIKKLKEEKETIDIGVNFLVKKPKKQWYEKYHWFYSSEGFLVIGGRDASSNEAVFKKHLEKYDTVLHTSFPGSPLTIIKNPENEKIPMNTIREAADFVASYSRGWKEAWGIVEVFHVSSDQVSKSPPSGEYLPRGSFMISGKKNFINDARTVIAVGLKFIEMESNQEEVEKVYYPKVLTAPENSLKSRVSDYLIIKPLKTGLSKGKLAKKIKSELINRADKEIKKWVRLLSEDDIILSLPNGNSVIEKI